MSHPKIPAIRKRYDRGKLSQPDSPQKEFIATRCEGDAVIGTVVCSIPGNLREATKILESHLHAIAHLATAQDGFIGHIKATAEERGRTSHLSMTDAFPASAQYFETSVKTMVKATIILYFIEKDTLNQWLYQEFYKYLP